LINFILVVQNTNLEMVTFSKVMARETLYVFIHATNSIQALQIVQVFKLDCLLIEENFSVTSGLELARSLQAQPRMKQVPTVVFGPYHILISQEQKTFSANKFPQTMPQMEILLALIDQVLLFPEQLLVHSFTTN
jgi:CheY-like chemotaxis protein